MTKLNKNFNHINHYGMFKLIILIYGKNTKKHVSKFMWDKEFHDSKFDKKQIFATGLEN